MARVTVNTVSRSAKGKVRYDVQINVMEAGEQVPYGNFGDDYFTGWRRAEAKELAKRLKDVVELALEMEAI